MENAKIILENGLETNVNGIFYIFNSKYYFMFTQGEFVDTDYVHLYIVQVCKEVKNTPNGQVDTGNMLGMEITNADEWSKVQTSITKIVDDKKNGTVNSEIQYLPINMLTNLKIVSKNKFKLMKHIVEENFKVQLQNQVPTEQSVVQQLDSITLVPLQQEQTPVTPIYVQQPIVEQSTPAGPIPLQQINSPVTPVPVDNPISNESDVIIDYRSKFFEEQEKNKELEEQIKALQSKLDSIKGIVE